MADSSLLLFFNYAIHTGDCNLTKQCVVTTAIHLAGIAGIEPALTLRQRAVRTDTLYSQSVNTNVHGGHR